MEGFVFRKQGSGCKKSARRSFAGKVSVQQLAES